MQHQRGRAEVFFTGLSAVPTAEVDQEEPFSPTTRSGKVVREIAGELSNATVYYTNLVKCLPLRHHKIRYPLRSELEHCFRFYKEELAQFNPAKVVLFGKQVTDFIAGKLKLHFRSARRDFDFPVARIGAVEYLAAYHPSYVLVYRHRRLDQYKQRVAAFLAG